MIEYSKINCGSQPIAMYTKPLINWQPLVAKHGTTAQQVKYIQCALIVIEIYGTIFQKHDYPMIVNYNQFIV